MKFEPGKIIVVTPYGFPEVRRKIVRIEGDKVWYSKPDGEHWIFAEHLDSILFRYKGRLEEHE